MARTPARPVGANFGSRLRAASIASGVEDERHPHDARRRLARFGAPKAQALVERKRGRVPLAGADAHPPAASLSQRVPDERRADAAPERRGRDEQPGDEQFLVTVLETDRAEQRTVLLAQPDLLAARLQLRDRLVRGRQLGIADQLRLDRVRRVLDREDARAQRRVRQVRPTPGSTCGDRRRRDR
jgi:hypothetical protein